MFCSGMCTRPFRPRPRRDRDVGNCVRDETETETETLQVAETLPRRLVTRSSAIAEGQRDASCQLKSCQLPRNSAKTTSTSPEQIEVMM